MNLTSLVANLLVIINYSVVFVVYNQTFADLELVYLFASLPWLSFSQHIISEMYHAAPYTHLLQVLLSIITFMTFHVLLFSIFASYIIAWEFNALGFPYLVVCVDHS